MLAAATRACKSWKSNRVYSVLPEMHRVVGDLVGLALANQPLGDNLKDAIVFARYSVGPGLGAYPSMFRFHPRYLLSRRRMGRFIQSVIQAHRDNPPNDERPADFIDSLLTMLDETGQTLPPSAVFANAQMVYTNSILYGGPSLAFVVHMVLQDQELYTRLVTEIDEALSSPITPQTMCRLPTVMKAVKESMRLHPVALATPRLVTKTFKFAGYEIKKGERLLIAGSVCHHLDDIHSKPDTVDLDRNFQTTGKNTYVPFGSGRHQCPAGGFMELVFGIAATAILRNVEVTGFPENYTLRKVVNPFPEPSQDFRFKIVRLRA